MKHGGTAILCVFLVVAVFGGPAGAKSTQGRLAQYEFVEVPQQLTNPPEIGGLVFQAAAANTVTLGWWQFDTPGGLPTKQGWTEHDLTAQIRKYWHVDGDAGSLCTGITPIQGSKSMWCGQWATIDYPWCGWATLPGYGNAWDQSLETTVTNVTTLIYTIQWDSEPGYDFTYLEWWDATNSQWVADATVNAAAGFYDGAGGPLTETATPAGAGLTGATKIRFHFVSDGAWSDQDGLWDTAEGAVKLDNLRLDAGPIEDWEDETCLAQQSTDGTWVVATIPPGFGIYAALHHGTTLLQEDPCFQQRSNLWGFFDDPSVTNYACGGWPLQGAMPYGPDASGFYMLNEIWSPWVPITGSGNEYILSFLTYRDLPLDNLQFYGWQIRTRTAGGCPAEWQDPDLVYYGGQKDWIRTGFQVGSFVLPTADEIMVKLGAYDYCGVWCGIHGSGACHSHAPLFDQVRIVRVNTSGPQWTVRVN